MKYLPMSICLGLIALSAIVHGATTHRWGALSDSDPRIVKLHAESVQLDDYEFVTIPSEMPLMERSIATCRSYTSVSRNQRVTVSVISGPAGAVSTHTPDVCYPSSGYKMVRDIKRESVDLPDGSIAHYYVAEFEKKTTTSVDRQRVRWAWMHNGQWEAPDRPRFAYLHVSDLAKVYIVTPEPEESEHTEDSAIVRQFVIATLSQYANLFASE